MNRNEYEPLTLWACLNSNLNLQFKNLFTMMNMHECKGDMILLVIPHFLNHIQKETYKKNKE